MKLKKSWHVAVAKARREFIAGATNPNSGKARTLIMVEAPGEKLATPFPKQGHRGTRYYDGAEWPG